MGLYLRKNFNWEASRKDEINKGMDDKSGT